MFSSSHDADPVVEKDSLLSAIKQEYKDVLDPGSEIILQLKSEAWNGEFVDFIGAAPTADHSVAKIVSDSIF